VPPRRALLSAAPLFEVELELPKKRPPLGERRVPSRRAGFPAAPLFEVELELPKKAASPGSVEFHLDGRACRLPSLFEVELELPKKRPPLGASSSISTGVLVGCPPCSRWNSNFQQNGLPWERRVPSRRARLSAALLVRGGTRTSPQNGLPWERRVPSRRALLSAAPCSRWNSNFP